MLSRLMGWYTVYTFLGALAPNGIMPAAKFTLHQSLAFSCIGIVTARHSSNGRQPNFVAWYMEWNYGTFAEGATYIRLGGHHVGHRHSIHHLSKVQMNAEYSFVFLYQQHRPTVIEINVFRLQQMFEMVFVGTNACVFTWFYVVAQVMQSVDGFVVKLYRVELRPLVLIKQYVVKRAAFTLYFCTAVAPSAAMNNSQNTP